jgi:tol-pal system protein YbgF
MEIGPQPSGCGLFLCLNRHPALRLMLRSCAILSTKLSFRMADLAGSFSGRAMNIVYRFALVVPVLALAMAPVRATAQVDNAQPYPMPGAGVNYETRLANIEDHMRALTGKVEQLEYALRRMDNMMQRMQGDYEQRLTKLESAPPPPTIVQAMPTASQPQADSPSGAETGGEQEEETVEQGAESANPETSVRGSLGALKVQGDKVTGSVKSPKSPPLPETPPDYGLTSQEQYDRAFSLLRQANYEEAEKAFKNFIDKNPKDSLLENAKYWYAETFYVRAKFNDAAVAFADAYQQNPKGTKAADSLLKLALTLAALDKTEDACTTLDGLKKDYPRAAATVRARADQERARLKCGKKN